MEISGALNQYMNICRDAFDGSAAKLNINFKSAIIETLLLFMVIPRKINFTQLERYGTGANSVIGKPSQKSLTGYAITWN